MVWGLPWWLSGKEYTNQDRRQRFSLWCRKIPYAAEQLSPTIDSVLPGTATTEAHVL